MSAIKPIFNRATVRIFGLFNERERESIANHYRDIPGNLVVTIRNDRIEVTFDRSDYIYEVPIVDNRGGAG